MRSAMMRALTFFVALSLMVATSSATVFPADGGQGDRAEIYKCPPYHVLVGVYGRTGAWIDQIGLICAEFSGSDWKRGNLRREAPKGGSGGTPQEKYCTGDSAIRQITPEKLFDGLKASAKYARSVRFACFHPRDGSAAGGAHFDAPSINYGVGSVSPIVDPPQTCPGSEYATGLNIRYGRHVNAIGLVCGAVEARPVAGGAGNAQGAGNGVQLAAGMEANTDRPGADYLRFHINDGRPDRCQSECARESDRCRAWTYVQPGLQHKLAVCYLKSEVPPPVAGSCCISGVQKRVVGLGRKPPN
jgi:hypothetical protein